MQSCLEITVSYENLLPLCFSDQRKAALVLASFMHCKGANHIGLNHITDEIALIHTYISAMQWYAYTYTHPTLYHIEQGFIA